MNLSTDTVQDLHWAAEGYHFPEIDLTKVTNQYVTDSRWEKHELVVVRDQAGQLWGFPWATGLTEMQDAWNPDPVVGHRVEAVPVTTIVYKKT
jgi:hypothetical protein